MNTPAKLKLSEKYGKALAQSYFLKRNESFLKRLANYRGEQLASDALDKAGEPGLVLDLPCGKGKFWPILAQKPNRIIIGADHSLEVLKTAMASQSAQVVSRVKALRTSAFDIELPDNSVDSIFCMRLLHQLGNADQRLTLLKEFYRVTRETVIVSLWVDGNFQSWRRKRYEQRRMTSGTDTEHKSRFVIGRSVAEEEFQQACFQTVSKSDFIPLYAMWRVYVLRKI